MSERPCGSRNHSVSSEAGLSTVKPITFVFSDCTVKKVFFTLRISRHGKGSGVS